MDFTGELLELELFLKKETRLQNVHLIVSPPESTGVKCFIDHGSSEEETGSFVEQSFPVTVTFSSEKSTWQAVLKNTIIAQAQVRKQKKHKWQVGNIERVESESDYILKLLITMKMVYA